MQSTSARRGDFHIIRQRRYALSRARKHRMRAVLLSRLVKRMRVKTVRQRHCCKHLTCCNLIHAASKTGGLHLCIGAAVSKIRLRPACQGCEGSFPHSEAAGSLLFCPTPGSKLCTCYYSQPPLWQGPRLPHRQRDRRRRRDAVPASWS